jgi:hypothetical protein
MCAKQITAQTECKGAHIGRSACGYQNFRRFVGRVATAAMPDGAVSQIAYLCIALFGTNVRFCRWERGVTTVTVAGWPRRR